MPDDSVTPKASLTEHAVNYVAEEMKCDADILARQMEVDPKYLMNNAEYKVFAVLQVALRLDLEQQLAHQMAANENMVREKDQLSVELADTKTKLEAALDHIRCEESISPTLPGVAELQAEVELGRRRHSEYRDEAEGEFIRYESELATLKARYAFHENQRLCDGYDGKCDGDLEGTAHEETCPARAKDLALRPHLYEAEGGTK